MRKENQKILVVGHKTPDTDSICSAIVYADYLRKKGKKAVAVRAGEINPETKFVLKYFQFTSPKLLESAKGKKIILVDHNEKTQSPADIEAAEILEVIDHHKIAFEYSLPIFFHTEPLGATATILAKKYFSDQKVKISKQMAGLLLSAILSDTIALHSPTTTKEDIEVAKKLAKIAKIKDIEKFGIEIKKKKATLQGMDPQSIIFSDFKTFDFSGKKVGIGQIEVCDLKEGRERKEALISKMKEILEKESYTLILLMITDIIKMASEILAVGQLEYLEKAFGKKVENNCLYLEGVVSRKKEVVPPLMKIFGG